jgi:FADH2 O2-dependent halogenase
MYTHFNNVQRLDPPGDPPPFPADDAAVHHIFDGGWIWVLRFNNGITSAGVAATDQAAARFGLSEGAPGWQRLLQCLPTVRDQFAKAVPERPFSYTPQLSFRSGAIAGRRWALLPSAAGFVDPLLSTGFPLVLLGVARLAEIFETYPSQWSDALPTYARQTEQELLATSSLVGSLYASMANFPLFVSLTLLYFAAASFSEAARRLGRPHVAGSFLLHDHPLFQIQTLLERARAVRTQEGTRRLNDEVRRIIEPFNVAGLGNPTRRNWYPAEAEDMLQAASKLGAERKEVARLLARCGF